MPERIARAVDHLADVAEGADADSYLRGLVMLAREHLELDIAYVSEFTERDQVFEVVEGNGASFGIEEGGAVPLPQTYCKRMLASEIPSLIPDARNDERVNCLPATTDSDIGAYVGIPIRFSDGRLFGTFCSISHASAPHLRERDLNFMRVLARLVGDYLEQQELTRKNSRLQIEAAGMEALAAALEARDGYTGEHSSAVVELCEAVAEVLGVEEPDLGVVKQVARLHDIGKVGIPDAILLKQGPLTDEEWTVMKTHPEIGRVIVEATSSLAHLGPAIGAEHEHWDGGGYPLSLAGDEIPLESRIVLACDAWHAMTSDRPYRKALLPEEATKELLRGRGSQFAPDVVDALVFFLQKQSSEAAISRYRRDKNNLSQMIRFERYLSDDDSELQRELRTSIRQKRASMRLSKTDRS